MIRYFRPDGSPATAAEALINGRIVRSGFTVCRDLLFMDAKEVASAAFMKIQDAIHQIPRDFVPAYHGAMSDLQSGVPNMIEKGVRDARALSSRMRRGQGQFGAQSHNYFTDADRELCSRVAEHLEGLADAAEAKLREARGEDPAAPDGYDGYCKWLETAWQGNR
jgi:hypothetical protein